MGKSRLCAELFRLHRGAPRASRWRQGRCLPYGEGIAFWALGEIVKAECGILESDSPEEARPSSSARCPRTIPTAPGSGPPGPARRRAGGACLPGGVVHGLAALPGVAGRTGPDRARLRGPALGGRGAARLPRAPGRLVAGRAAAPALHGPPGAARAAPDLGGRAAQRDHDQPRPAHRRGDGAADRLAARARGPAGGDAAGTARAGGRQPAVRGGVRAPARRPRAARGGGGGGAGLGAGADRRPAGHALARAQEPAPGRRRDRQGVLGGRAGRDGRARPARGRAGAARARAQGARPPAPHELDAGEAEYGFWHLLVRDVCYAQIPAPPAPPATAPRPPGSSARPASGPRTWPTCSPTTT